MTDLSAPITAAIVAEHGLNVAEYDIILDRLGRAPNLVELGIFSVMWSEHCSYKSSRRHLAKFPTSGRRVIQGPGENAGVIDIGDGQAAVFKMESHNHPSFIEPYQGAATGVGGIMRDVFTMGARPIALANALRFGAPDHPLTKRLVSGVVAGISGYGNCVGVPTVCGETNFHSGYNGNILVNAMCVGLADADRIFYARGAKVGSPIVYFGSKTGRDGIHGATMASAEFDDASEEKRPTVQVGDPFIEKLLIEACLELMQSDAIEAIQDMGAAGLTSSSVEMAGKEYLGIRLNMNSVPCRETGMTPYEMMLSESQERMLAILKPGREHVAQAIMEKWDIDFAVIGITTDTGRMVLDWNGEVVCDIPVAPLSEDAPNYDRPWVAPAKPLEITAADLPPIDDWRAAVLKLVGCPDGASKRWIWEQYDRHVMADSLEESGTPSDAAVVRIHGTGKALAITCDCTPRYVQNDPYEGGKQVVAEAWRNLTAVGAEPIAITDNLNFGNPERPEIMGQFVLATTGMAEACAALDFAVVSGNVSLYNETSGVAIPPTPAIGGVGLLADSSIRAGFGQVAQGDVVILVGETQNGLGATLALRELWGREDGAPPPVDLALERKTGDAIRALIQEGAITTCHDLSDGGLLIAAADVAMASGIGLALDTSVASTTALLAECQARYLVIASQDQAARIYEALDDAGIANRPIGIAGGCELAVQGLFAVDVSDLKDAHENWMPGLMG
jgi:phosphoribosylformylglycinamidine synthase subunit PurL